jgi:hypothetical protein
LLDSVLSSNYLLGEINIRVIGKPVPNRGLMISDETLNLAIPKLDLEVDGGAVS